jgi:outer membrane protein
VLLSPDEKQKQEAVLVQKQQALQQRAGQIEQQASARQDELMKPVMDRVQKAIDDIRVAGNYGLILDVASGAMVAADSTLDLTTQVIERLRASANDTSGTMAAASGNNSRSQRNPPKKP